MANKILATTSGWLIPVEVLRETPLAHIVKARDERKEWRVEKASTTRKLFDNCDQAMAWQGVDIDG